MNTLFRLFLAFNATSLLVVVYLVQNDHTLVALFTKPESTIGDKILWFAITCVIYFVIPVALTGLSVLVSSKLGSDEFKKDEVSKIEHANNSFLPSYLAYFFVALSIHGWWSLAFVYMLLFVFTFLSQALYFNPLFLVFGYSFYNITTKNGTSIFLISKNKYKNPSEVIIETAFRINNYTFIERK